MRFIEDIVLQHYGMEIIQIKKLTVGAGSNTYLLSTDHGKFILKNANINEANNPQNEPSICQHLLQKGLLVSEFILDKEGYYVWTHDSNIYHMQKYIEGVNYKWNSAPNWLLSESARILGNIHYALQDYPALPIGIGENFFKYVTPVTALKSYENSYQHAKNTNDSRSVEDLSFRIELMKRFSIPDIQFDKLTCRNTHGDYFISQLICGKNKINAVIDWTTACIHPIVWEIIRSYVYAAPECSNGKIDIAQFILYVKQYLNSAILSEYDLKMMAYIFYYQISVCDYYNQYYQSEAHNREIFLQQAIFSTKLMRWFDININELSDALTKIAQ